MNKWFKIILQVTFLSVFVWIGNFLTHALHVNIPGSIVGLLLLFLLLQLKIIPVGWVETGANWLLAEMLLFFIPSAVGVIQYQQLMTLNGWRIALVIVGSTLVVMLCTGLIAEFLNRQKEEQNHGHLSGNR